MESGLDPALLDWYIRHFNTPAIDYPLVTTPGRVVRDSATGQYRTGRLSIREYFQTLGVEALFSSADPESIRAMQYAAINPLGFVGYQVGEAILVATGFYAPARVELDGREFDSYYVGGLPPDAYRAERRDVVMTPSGLSVEIVVTDVNTWRGHFLGRYGIHSLDDLRTRRQEYVIRDLMDFNHESMASILRSQGTSLARELSRSRSVPATISGVLAAAHLCGAAAVVAFLTDGIDAIDEFGTPLSRYLSEFGGYDAPYVSRV